jgi:hypothetical protein
MAHEGKRDIRYRKSFGNPNIFVDLLDSTVWVLAGLV